MYAIFKTGGKQYRVSEGDTITVEKLDAAEEKIENFKNALAQYEETRELLEDLDDEIQDKVYEIQDNNAEILNYELELRITVYDNELKKIDSVLFRGLL